MKAVNTLLIAIGALAAGEASAQALRGGEVLSSISATALSAPHPVRGSDGRLHLAFEIALVNTSHVFVRLEAVDAVDGAGHDLSHLEGDRLAAMLTRFAGTGTELAPGGSGTVIMDVALAGDAAVPTRLAARLTIRRQAVGPGGAAAPWAADAPLPAQTSFVGAETPVGAPAREISPPLRGPGWVAVNGCCDSVTPHRGALLAVNGVLRAPERFAIDWVQLGADRQAMSGPADQLASYRYYGTPVHAVADGVVANRLDGVEEQAPGAEPKGVTPEAIGGNMLAIDIGGGAFAFYAHMQKGSLRVALGDRVVTGQVIGLLGNTGNTTAPHLHFHLMDGPSPLAANGLPFTLTGFRRVGTLAGPDDWLDRGVPARIDADGPVGERVGQMPLNNDVTDFQ